MSQEPTTLPKDRIFPASMDYKALRLEGLELAQQLSGDIWTDYNAHDPGVTLLETFCYAMTELGYKAHFPVEDLLYAKGLPAFDPADNALYPAPDVLPCAPLTLYDYRRLLIDRVSSVKNAWLHPIDETGNGINMTGIFHVRLQIESGDKEEMKATVEHAKAVLNAHRNLTEDFEYIEVLKSEKIGFTGEIAISPNVVGETVWARILFALSEALTPSIPFYSMEDLVEKGHDISTIFNGPLPIHGFILDEDLRRSELYSIHTLQRSRLIRILNEVEGVVSVNSFQLTVGGKAIEKEIIHLEPNCFPELDLEILLARENVKEHPVRLMIGDIRYEIDTESASHSYDMMVARYKQQYEKPLDLSIDPPVSDRKVEQIESFSSMQENLPPTYGVGRQGLPSRASRVRKGQAKQLQGYLLFMEQLMGNYMTQLTHIRDLLSTSPKLDATYFWQDLSDMPGGVDLFGEGEKYRRELADLVAKYDPVSRRRNRFLDHLLARFGEEFMTESFNTLNRQAAGVDQQAFEEALIRAKTNYLKTYISISRDRGRGIDYTLPYDDPDNVAGLKKRICLLFNFHSFEDRPLTSIATHPKVKLSRSGKGKKAGSSFSFAKGDKQLLAEVLSRGLDRNVYRIDDADGKSGSVIYFTHHTGEEEVVFKGASVEACEEALTQLLDTLHQLNQDSEGFHLVEHILLRPVGEIRYQAYFAPEENRLLATDFVYPDETTAEKTLFKALEKGGGEAKNYTVKPDPDMEDEFMVIFSMDREEIAYQKGFVIEASAKKHIQTVSKMAKSLKGKKLAAAVIGEEQIKEGARFSDDPYSATLSVVLPAWNARFQNQKLRTLLENIIRFHAPAHLVINFFWVGIEQLKEFEDIYFAWRTEKQNIVPDQPLLDELAYFLMLLLRSFDQPDNPEMAELIPVWRRKYGTNFSLMDV
ncbi:MAG: hypothetical protein AAFV07_01580 [Bacteroidota bacterium]